MGDTAWRVAAFCKRCPAGDFAPALKASEPPHRQLRASITLRMVWSTLLVSGDPQVVGVAARQKLAVLPKVLCSSQQPAPFFAEFDGA